MKRAAIASSRHHDPVEQTRKVMQNIRQLLEESGGRMEHVTKLPVYLTDVGHREAVYPSILPQRHRTADRVINRSVYPAAYLVLHQRLECVD